MIQLHASTLHSLQFVYPRSIAYFLNSRDKLPQTFPVFSTLHSAGWRPGDKASHSLKHYDSTDLHSLKFCTSNVWRISRVCACARYLPQSWMAGTKLWRYHVPFFNIGK